MFKGHVITELMYIDHTQGSINMSSMRCFVNSMEESLAQPILY